MDVFLVTASGAESRSVDELPALLERGDGIVWVDIPGCDDEAERVLFDVFKFHPLAVKDACEPTACRSCTPTATTSSSCCTRRSWAGAGMCTTSSWTSSSAGNT